MFLGRAFELMGFKAFQREYLMGWVSQESFRGTSLSKWHWQGLRCALPEVDGLPNHLLNLMS